MCGKVIKRQKFKRKYNQNEKKKQNTFNNKNFEKKTRKIFFYEKLKKLKRK